MSRPLVSILIPAFNTANWIEESIQSALDQTWPNKEIIVVDDGSKDNTLAIARSFESQGVKIFSQTNRGASAARNRAFLESKGDYIQYLDGDDLLDPEKISKQLQLLDGKNTQMIASCGWGIFYDDIKKAYLRPTELWQDYADPLEWLLAAWQKDIFMVIHSWLTPRTLIEKAGPWDETLSVHDDGEFFTRVLLASQGVVFCPDTVAYYRKGITSSISSNLTLQGMESRMRVYELCEQHIRNIKDTNEVRKGCADNYQKFVYQAFPDFPLLMQQAVAHVERLGGSNKKLVKSTWFNGLSSFFGWKKAVLIERRLRRMGLAPEQIKQMVKSKLQ